ncbi:hypothetical protein [Nocardia cyriacigeorgica]|uniref:hypothetical protein n=1 Tax=Nocardia cyriacigeorgica TaxID=135487 RepID=UPI002454A4E1|nr:hypothetical protein [Nocardia cyriacigeorgica]
MKKYVIALGAAALMLSGCGDDGNASSDTTTTSAPASATTTAMPPISLAQEAQPYATAVDQRIAPCLDNGGVSAVNAMSPQCSVAISYTVAALKEWYDRLHSGTPSARKAVQTEIADLEYWRDVCIPSQANTPQRLACVQFIVTNDISMSVMSAFSEDANRGR